jgi:hypothetical protein
MQQAYLDILSPREPRPLDHATVDTVPPNISEAIAPSSFWTDRAEYNAIHAAAQAIRMEGSGVWLKSHPSFVKWKTREKTEYDLRDNMLYCYGSPGSGKTILT